MSSQMKARQLATKFDKVYPESLPERLEWWCKVLKLQRTPLLRIMGMSSDESNRMKDTSWSDLLEARELVENAWWVEGKLHELLTLFGYDWIALAGRIHHPLEAQRQKKALAIHPIAEIEYTEHLPRNVGTEILINRIAMGGLESFTALISYLARESES